MTPDIPETDTPLFLESVKSITVLQKDVTVIPPTGTIPLPRTRSVAVVTQLLDPIYGKRLWLMHGERDACARYLRSVEACPGSAVPDLGKGSGHSAIHENGQWVYAWVDEKTDPSNARGLAIISHECFHVTCRIMEEVGMELTFKSEEAYAYYQTWMLESWLSVMELTAEQCRTSLKDRVKFKVISVDSLDRAEAKAKPVDEGVNG